MAAPSDAELMTAWRSGDERAGQQLFDRYYEGLARFFRTKVGDEYADLVQHTFLATVEGKFRIRDPASFRSYLFAVAYKQLYRHYAKTERAITREELGSKSAAELGPTPSAIVGRKEAAKRLLVALRSLPIELQVTFELYTREGLTAAEIADVLDAPLGTVKTRLRQARLRLVEILQQPSTPAALVATDELDLDGWSKKVRHLLDA